MATLKWNEEKQGFEYRTVATRFSGGLVFIPISELPANARVEKSDGKIISATIDDDWLKTKVPTRIPGKETTQKTKSEYFSPQEILRQQEEAITGLPDTTPFGNEVRVNIQSVQDIANSKNYSKTAAGVGYIAPDAPAGTEPSMVVIKPKKQYLGTTFSETVDVTTAEEAMAEVLNEARQTPGGITALKQKLISSGFYSGELAQLAPYSLALKDKEDDYLETALALALRSQSITNYGYAKQGRSLLDFDGWLKEAEAAYSSVLDQKTINYADPRDARAEIIAKWQKYTGETPDENQILAILSSLNSYAAKNPDVASTDLFTGTRINKPGFNPQQLDQFVSDFILQTPEAKEYGMEQGGVDMFSGAVDGLLAELRLGIQ